jgi:DNA (cytosine-5)-methyltransferase 1
MDFETETFITHSLSADGFDASEDGTGRGVPLIAGTLNTCYGDSSGQNFSDGFALLPVAFNLRGRDGGAMPELSDSASVRASAGGSSNSYVAFSAKDSGSDADEIAPTLRGMGHENSHANGGGQVAVAFTLHGSDSTASTATPTDVAGSVRTRAPGSVENSSTTVAQQGMAVRRLTPRECERLQGFPDDYTLIEYRCKLAADGPRYKALGNSMAVPVIRWIGQRIAAVHEIVSRRSL